MLARLRLASEQESYVAGKVPALTEASAGTGEKKGNSMTSLTYTRRWNGATPPRITGNQIALKRFTKRERARIAAAIMDGRTQLEALNQGQIASLCKVSLAYARLMRRPQGVAHQLQAAE
jgi:hypothetical protein